MLPVKGPKAIPGVTGKAELFIFLGRNLAKAGLDSADIHNTKQRNAANILTRLSLWYLL